MSTGKSQSSKLTAARGDSERRGEAGAVENCPLKKHWIRIRLQSEDGEPIGDESCVVVDSDGAEHPGQVDENGEVLIRDLPDGPCRVVFPDLYKRQKPNYL